MTGMKNKILLQADYPDPANAPSYLDSDVHSITPILPIADLGTTVIEDGSKDQASIRDRASINYFALQTPASKRDRASIWTWPLFGPGLYSDKYSKSIDAIIDSQSSRVNRQCPLL